MSRFHSGLKNELRRELIVRDVSTLEQAIQIVQDLDQSEASSFPRRTDYRDNPNKTTVKFNPIYSNLKSRLGIVVPLQGMKTKARVSLVSHLGLFSRLYVSSAKGLVTFQHNVRVRQGR